MKKLFAAIIALALMLGMASCSKSESADASDLLATVPSDATVVAVANLKALLEKSGCEVKDGKVSPSQEVTDAVSGMKDPSARAFAQSLLDGESGVDPSVCAFFIDGYYRYITGVASDPSALKSFAEKRLGGKFTTEEGVGVCGNVAVIDNRFWILLGQGSIDAREVKGFMALSEQQSFLSKPASQTLAKLTEDVALWGDIAGAFNSFGFDFQQRAIAQMLSQALFDDASAILLTASAGDAELKAKCAVLNAKGEYAKYLLPTDALDVETVESLGGSAQTLVALSVPHKMIEQLQKAVGSKGASLVGIYLQAFGSVDGTVALALGADKKLNGVITTDGGSSAQLSSLLNEMGMKTRIDGRNVMIGEGPLQGGAPVSTLTSDMKGAVGALVAIPQAGQAGIPAGMRSLSLAMRPEKGGVTLHVAAKTDGKSNILLELLK